MDPELADIDMTDLDTTDGDASLFIDAMDSAIANELMDMLDD